MREKTTLMKYDSISGMFLSYLHLSVLAVVCQNKMNFSLKHARGKREREKSRKKERNRWQNHTVIDTTLILPALHDACFQALILWYFSLIVYDDSLTFVAFSQDSSTLPSSAHQETSHKLHHTMNTYNILSQKFSKSLFVHIPVFLSRSLYLSHPPLLSLYLSIIISVYMQNAMHALWLHANNIPTQILFRSTNIHWINGTTENMEEH